MFWIFILLIVAIIVIGLVTATMFKKTLPEVAFVRTGLGKAKVIVNGGTIVLPVFHQLVKINLNTMVLSIAKNKTEALITKDRMRVDIGVDFYLKVQQTGPNIILAAQTLGTKTLNLAELKTLVEGKFTDYLRAVAAEMTLQELHENRSVFTSKVQEKANEDLQKNGLQLETAALTTLDQTSIQYFNADNTFDAEGLTKLTEQIATRKKERNEIERNTEVAIATKNLETEKEKLDIERDSEIANLNKNKTINFQKATQEADIAKQASEEQKKSEEAQILATQGIEMATINKSRELETASIKKSEAIEIAQQDKAIQLANKSKDQSKALADAAQATAEKVKAEEQIITVQETEKANREKAVELINASREADKSVIKDKTQAEAKKEIAKNEGEALKLKAIAEAESIIISSKAETDADKLRLDISKERYVIDANGTEAINKAMNLLSEIQVNSTIKLALIKNLPSIIEQQVKPMERIDSIKIVDINGLGLDKGNNVTSKNGDVIVNGQTESLSDQVVNSALRFKTQAPILDNLVKECGLDDLTSMVDLKH